MSTTEIDLRNIRILHVDDHDVSIKKMSNNIKSFNRNPDNYDLDENIQITLSSYNKVHEAISFFDKRKDINVVICDHNMPEGKGLDLIKDYFMKHTKNADMVYALHTGESLPKEIKEECDKFGIIYSTKSEEFDVLLHRIMKKLYAIHNKNELKSPLYDFYISVASDLIDELINIESKLPDFKILIGSDEYSPKKMLHEIDNATPIGLYYLKSYVNGLKFFKKNKKND